MRELKNVSFKNCHWSSFDEKSHKEKSIKITGHSNGFYCISFSEQIQELCALSHCKIKQKSTTESY